MREDCIFCKIVKGELPASYIEKDKDFIVIKDINPAAPVHVLIIPRKHIKNLSKVKDSDKEMLGKIQISIPKISKKLGISQNFRLLVANGKGAGQTVLHLHYHLIGGWKNKSSEMEIEPGSLQK